MAGQGARKERLTMFAQRLKPVPELLPYYLHNPAGDEQHPAPGWYFKLDGETVYLGFSAGDAEQSIRDKLRAQAPKPRRRKAA